MDSLTATQGASKKRNSDARRHQNREASRAYRQKRKQKLALLDQLLTPDDGRLRDPVAAGVSISATSPAQATPSYAIPSGVPQASSTARLAELPPNPSSDFSSFNDSPTSFGPWASSSGSSLLAALTDHGWTDMLEFAPDHGNFNPALDDRLRFVSESSLRIETLAPTLLSARGSPASRPTTDFSGAVDRFAPFSEQQREENTQDEAVLGILSGVRNLSLKQKQDLLRQLRREVKEPDEGNDFHLYPSRQSTFNNNWVSAYPRAGHSSTRLQFEARRFAAFVDKYASGTVGPAQLARIYTAEASLFGAMFANCYALGMNDVEPLMVEEGVSIFSLGPDTGYHPSQLTVVRPKFEGVTPDLRPCDVQLTYGHHPYLDVLPFKVFREKALEALEHDPPLLDEDELCRDLSAGALVCWGSQHNSHGMEVGVPWDARSWEPKPWFLKKYWQFVGDLDGEMWTLARMWHRTRNEKVFNPGESGDDARNRAPHSTWY